ncbi:MAG: lipopolysaccharide biosynthesis protein [Sporomusaceae bacterium]|nr:lipopolysaccharide biosynthesis protein [Sporomusaceae bacterium]
MYQTFKKGILVNFIARYTNIIINILTTAFLARLLEPAEFGVVAVVTVFTTFFSLLTEMGIGPAIVQQQDLDERETAHLFIFTMGIGVVTSGVFWGLAPWVAAFYQDSVYISITRILAVAVFFSTGAIVPMALLNKRQKFALVSKISIAANSIVSIITVFLAFHGFSFYSIALKSVAFSIIVFFLTLFFSKLAVRFEFQKSSLKKVLRFSSYQFSFNLINYFSRNLDNILIGKFLGASSLGLYDKAYSLMLYPVQNLTHVITPIMHPILAKYQSDYQFIYDTYLRIVKILALLGIPISVFCYFSAEEIIYIFYGEKWLGIVPTFRILAATIWIQVILSSSGTIFQAANRTDMLFYSGTLSAGIMVLAIALGVASKCLETLAMYLLIAFIINFLQAYYILINKVLKRSVVNLYISLLNPMLIGIIMSMILYVFQIEVENHYLSLFIKVVINLLVYAVLIRLTKEYVFFNRF